jgi:hypothetical protein
MRLFRVVIHEAHAVRGLILLSSLIAALAVGVETATAGGGNSGNAQACRNGGWQNVVGPYAAAFRSQGDCISYVGQGGTLSPKSASQVLCESYGGTFSTDPTSSYFDNPLAVAIWTCNRGDLTSPNDAYLAADCFHNEGGAFAWETNSAPWYFTCYS